MSTDGSSDEETVDPDDAEISVPEPVPSMQDPGGAEISVPAPVPSTPTQDTEQARIDLAKRRLRERFADRDIKKIAPGTTEAGDVFATVEFASGELKSVDNVVSGGAGPEGTQLFRQTQDEALLDQPQDVRDFLTGRGIDPEAIETTTVGGQPGAIIEAREFEGTSEPDIFRNLAAGGQFALSPVDEQALSEQRQQQRQRAREQLTQQVREQFGGLVPADEIEAGDEFEAVRTDTGGFRADFADPFMQRVETARREDLRERAAERAGPEFTEDDIGVEEGEGGRLTAGPTLGAELREAREAAATQSALATDPDVVVEAFQQVQDQLSREQRIEFKTRLSESLGGEGADQPIDISGLPPVFEEAVGQEALAQGFLGVDKEAILAAEDQADLTPAQERQFGVELSEAATENAPIDVQDLPRPVQERLVDTLPQQTAERVTREGVRTDVVEAIPGLAREDVLVEETEEGAFAGDVTAEAERRLAGEDVAQQLEEQFGGQVAEPINLGDEFTLTRTDEGAFEPELAEDFQQAVSGPGLAEQVEEQFGGLFPGRSFEEGDEFRAVQVEGEDRVRAELTDPFETEVERALFGQAAAEQVEAALGHRFQRRLPSGETERKAIEAGDEVLVREGEAGDLQPFVSAGFASEVSTLAADEPVPLGDVFEAIGEAERRGELRRERREIAEETGVGFDAVEFARDPETGDLQLSGPSRAAISREAAREAGRDLTEPFGGVLAGDGPVIESGDLAISTDAIQAAQAEAFGDVQRAAAQAEAPEPTAAPNIGGIFADPAGVTEDVMASADARREFRQAEQEAVAEPVIPGDTRATVRADIPGTGPVGRAGAAEAIEGDGQTPAAAFAAFVEDIFFEGPGTADVTDVDRQIREAGTAAAAIATEGVVEDDQFSLTGPEVAVDPSALAGAAEGEFQQAGDLFQLTSGGPGEVDRDIIDSLFGSGGFLPEGEEELRAPPSELTNPFTSQEQIEGLSDREVREQFAAANPGIEAEDVTLGEDRVPVTVGGATSGTGIPGQLPVTTFGLDVDEQDIRERVAAVNPGVDPEDVEFTAGGQPVQTTGSGDVFQAAAGLVPGVEGAQLTERALLQEAQTQQERFSQSEDVRTALQNFGAPDEVVRVLGGVEGGPQGAAGLPGELAALPATGVFGFEQGAEFAENVEGTVEEFGGPETAATVTEGGARIGAGLAATARANPLAFGGELGAELILGAAAFSGAQRGARAVRSSRTVGPGGPEVDLDVISDPERLNEQGIALFDTPPGAPTEQAVREIREEAADQPTALQDAFDVGEGSLIFRSESDPIRGELEVERGEFELEGLFGSPIASRIRLREGGTTQGLPRPRIGLPRLRRRDDEQVTAFPGERVEGMPESARGAGFVVEDPEGNIVFRNVGAAEGRELAEEIGGTRRPDPEASGSVFLREEAEPGTAFVRPPGSRSREMEAIFPPGSVFEEVGEFRVRRGTGDVIPGTAFRRVDVEAEDADDLADLEDAFDGDLIPGRQIPETRVSRGRPESEVVFPPGGLPSVTAPTAPEATRPTPTTPTTPTEFTETVAPPTTAAPTADVSDPTSLFTGPSTGGPVTGPSPTGPSPTPSAPATEAPTTGVEPTPTAPPSSAIPGAGQMAVPPTTTDAEPTTGAPATTPFGPTEPVPSSPFAPPSTPAPSAPTPTPTGPPTSVPGLTPTPGGLFTSEPPSVGPPTSPIISVPGPTPGPPTTPGVGVPPGPGSAPPGSPVGFFDVQGPAPQPEEEPEVGPRGATFENPILTASIALERGFQGFGGGLFGEEDIGGAIPGTGASRSAEQAGDELIPNPFF